MNTAEAVIISQIPLGVACIVVAYELYRIRKEFERIRKLKGEK